MRPELDREIAGIEVVVEVHDHLGERGALGGSLLGRDPRQTARQRQQRPSGSNTVAVEVTQDNATNSWSVNPTFFQGKLVIPTQ